MTTSQSETLATGPLNLSKGGVASGSISERVCAVGTGSVRLSLPLPVSPGGGDRRAIPLTKMPSPRATLALQTATIVYDDRRSVDIVRRAHTVRNSLCKM